MWRVEENRSGAGAKPAPEAQIGAKDVRNRLPARIFTVDNPYNERTIQNGQVSQLSHNQTQCRFRLGTNETCEEKL